MPSLNSLLQKTGQFPGVSIKMVPLQTNLYANAQYGVTIDNFIDYRFRSSVIQPIESFSFTFAYPAQNQPFSSYIRDGDAILLFVNVNGQEYPLSTGIIDSTEVQVSASGEIVTVSGRNLLGQWEDQGIFTPDGDRIFAGQMSPQTIFGILARNTRTQKMKLQGLGSNSQLIGGNPMESKLAVLVRYLEPSNCIPWMGPDGTLIMGKPNMSQPISGNVIVSKKTSTANCISIRSCRSSATIPNYVVPILSAQTNNAIQVAKQQGIANPQPGPKRLLSLGHRFTRVFTTSDPDGNLAQSLNATQSLTNAGGNALSKCRAYGMREIARENMKELMVQSVMPGHLNENGQPYQIDQVYQVVFDRDGVDAQMYLYEVEYSSNEKEGPRTLLMFTNFNTIVMGNNFK